MKKKIILIGSIVIVFTGLFLLWYFGFNPKCPIGTEKYGSEYVSYLTEKFTGYHEEKAFSNVYCEINQKRYRSIQLADRVSYGLLTQEYVSEMRKNKSAGTDVYRHEFVKSDIGSLIGETAAAYPFLPKGLKVYHYAPFPDSDEIVIVEFGDHFGYSFYILDSPDDYIPGGTIPLMD